MARRFTRPEFSATDLSEFQAARCVMINPTKKDVALALKKTEKRCRKNKLPTQEAERAWETVMEDGELSAGAGQWSCPARFTYGIQGTVLQVIRISDELTGLICDRQDVAAGQSSQYPISSFTKASRRKKPKKWLNGVLQSFWTHLTDEEIEGLEQEVTLLVMEAAAARRVRAANRKAKAIRLRRKNIRALFRGQTPTFVTEFRESCRRVAEEMRQQAMDAVSWKEFKQWQPSLAARYQPELLTIIENNRIGAEQIASVQIDTPYSLSFSVWEGIQRIFKEPQLVLRIRNTGIHKRFQEQGGEYREVSKKLKAVAAFDYHPGTAYTIGWLRIHVDDDNGLCFIDEIQSDAMEKAREMELKAAKEFVQECKSWHIHGFATVYHWARDIGYKVAIHSRESAKKKHGMTPSERKWNTYYQSIIKRFGLQPVVVKGYPDKIWASPE